MGEAKRRAELVSVLIPERGRPEMLERLIQSLIETAGNDQHYEILVAIDDADPKWEGRTPRPHFRVAYHRWPRPITLGEHLNELARSAPGPLMWFVANDQIVETPGWPQAFRTAASKLPHGIGVLHAKDDHEPGHPTYWAITRQMRDSVGFFAAPWFPYWFVDTWWAEVGLLLDQLHEVPIAVSAPDGRGKTHGMVDLGFWVRFFNETRQLRVRDAANLATTAYGEGSDGLKGVLASIPPRHGICVQRTAHLSDPRFLEMWGSNSDSLPSPQYPEVRQYAERLLAQLNANAPRRVKVAVCCPSGRTWEASTATCIAAVCAYSAQAGIDVSIMNVQSSAISHGRNQTVKSALEIGVDYLWWVDSDMVVPREALMRLLAHGKDIVAATYNKRTFPHTTLGLLEGPQPERIGPEMRPALLMPGGMMLVKADVYRNFGFPWYFEAYRFAGDDGLEAFKDLLRSYFTAEPPADVLASMDGTPFGEWMRGNYTLGEHGEDFPYFSEDLAFCRRARRHGFSIHCDIGLTWDTIHLGQLEVTCRPADTVDHLSNGAPKYHGGAFADVTSEVEALGDIAGINREPLIPQAG